MISNTNIMGPQAPPPSKFVEESDAFTPHWVQRVLCILSNHTAMCCQGKIENANKSRKSMEPTLPPSNDAQFQYQ